MSDATGAASPRPLTTTWCCLSRSSRSTCAGASARLGPALDAILTRHAYPAPVARLLGEAAALTVLLGAALKIEGRFQLQTRSDGVVDMLVVDFDAPDRLRAFARFDAKHWRRPEQRVKGAVCSAAAISPSPSNRAARWRAIRASRRSKAGLEAGRAINISASPSKFRPSSGSRSGRRDAGGSKAGARAACWCSFCRIRRSAGARPISHPGDAPEGHVAPEVAPRMMPGPRPKRWPQRSRITNWSIPASPASGWPSGCFTSAASWSSAPSRARACRCSDERIEAMLRGFSQAERDEMVGEDGRIGVTCEFCSTLRRYHPRDFEAGLSSIQSPRSQPLPSPGVEVRVRDKRRRYWAPSRDERSSKKRSFGRSDRM